MVVERDYKILIDMITDNFKFNEDIYFSQANSKPFKVEMVGSNQPHVIEMVYKCWLTCKL